VTFTGHIAAVRNQHSTIPEIVLDNGSLTQPDGKVFTGDFSITYPEGSLLTYSLIPPDSRIPFSIDPYIFHGSIQLNSSIPTPTLSGMPVPDS